MYNKNYFLFVYLKQETLTYFKDIKFTVISKLKFVKESYIIMRKELKRPSLTRKERLLQLGRNLK